MKSVKVEQVRCDLFPALFGKFSLKWTGRERGLKNGKTLFYSVAQWTPPCNLGQDGTGHGSLDRQARQSGDRREERQEIAQQCLVGTAAARARV